MRSEADIWVCGRCRSINPLSRGRCYRCSTPKEVAAARPEDLTVSHFEQPPEPTGVFRSGEPFAVATSIATVAFIFAALFAAWSNWNAVDLWAAGKPEAGTALLSDRLPLLLLAPATGVLALLAFATWIRRVVQNLPALGAGYSRVSPTWAFVEPLIPGFNVYAIPARMGEAITKLGGHPTAMPLLGLALVIAFGPPVAFAFVLRFTRIVGTGADVREAVAIGLLVTTACVGLALVIGLVVMWQIEALARTKHAALQSGTGARG